MEQLSKKELQTIKCQKYLSIPMPITPALSFVAVSSCLQLSSLGDRLEADFSISSSSHFSNSGVLVLWLSHLKLGLMYIC